MKRLLLILLTFPLFAGLTTVKPSCTLYLDGVQVGTKSNSEGKAISKALTNGIGVYKNVCPDQTITVTKFNYETPPVVDVPPVEPATGTAKLTWTAPTQNTDNSQLTDLSGFIIYYGTNKSNLSNSIQSSSTQLELTLEPGTYHFAVTAINSSGIESELSNIATKEIKG